MDNFKTYLRIALHMGGCKLTQAARECGMHDNTMYNWDLRERRLRKSNAHRLAQCAVKHINKRIAEKQQEIRDLYNMGESLKRVFREEYCDEKEEAVCE